jgi:hypothetical protein
VRLLDVDSYELREFIEPGAQEYAILSHTWSESDEVNLQEWNAWLVEQMQTAYHVRTKSGFAKIERAMKRTREDGLKYLWIDTNCTIQTYYRQQCPTKRVVSTAENEGSYYLALNTKIS